MPEEIGSGSATKIGRDDPRGSQPGDCVVRVRAVLAGDEVGLLGMFSRLSRNTIYLRFHAPYPGVPGWALEQFAGAARFGGGSLVAVVGDRIIGHAIYVHSENAREAEVAIVVEDGWRSRGVGKKLLATLAENAARGGVEVLTGQVLGENRHALGLFEAVFDGLRYSVEGGVYQVRAPLGAPSQAAHPSRQVA